MPKKTQTLERIDSDPQYAAASLVLQTLQNGMQAVEREIGSLRLEGYLSQSRVTRDPREKDLRERLAKNRASAPQLSETPVSGDMPLVVAQALELLRAGVRPEQRDRPALIAKLQTDFELLHEAIIAHAPVVEELRSALIAAQAARDLEHWAALQLRKFRVAQALAAIKDEEDDFRKSRIDAGFAPWRNDLLPTVASRPVLVLGSERDWDSEISRTRRQLEEQKII